MKKPTNIDTHKSSDVEAYLNAEMDYVEAHKVTSPNLTWEMILQVFDTLIQEFSKNTIDITTFSELCNNLGWLVLVSGPLKKGMTRRQSELDVLVDGGRNNDTGEDFTQDEANSLVKEYLFWKKNNPPTTFMKEDSPEYTIKRNLISDKLKNSFENKPRAKTTAKEIENFFQATVADFLLGKIDTLEFNSLVWDIFYLYVHTREEAGLLDIFTQNMIYESKDFIHKDIDKQNELKKIYRRYLIIRNEEK